mmetsp:Transcript_16155/g.21385  ORF Transcript_16155/g.21385 Transcript_16155/m.21385 type:complete len:463 (-) Transcript_16155:233-1621(-)|eukprot:CAMPEP_0117746886 /NCGR_PEP_ID=MMETSP0947-20121206/8198_1 /TAXON_ID=44440 /ORGANISM="Chattonella subsalsa, Strain CCMP2191" /LENGTH=462 /DNA_ID=CAMNT_0005564265 /DNA_START=266 /DNA_END=1654 /DNA_ORIENTATION=-
MVGVSQTFNLLHSRVVRDASKLPAFISAYKDSRSKIIQLGRQHSPAQSKLEGGNLENVLLTLSQKQTTRMSLKALYKFGLDTSPESLLKSAQFLHKELPIRFAQRIIQLRQLPWGLSKMESIVDARGWYHRILHEILECPHPTTESDLHRFSCLLASINLDLNSMPIAVAKAMLTWRRQNGFNRIKWQEIDEALDRVFMQRLASTTLVDHFISTTAATPGFAGVIQKQCCAFEVVEQAAQNVQALSTEAMGACPEIIVVGSKTDFTYVPSHLFFILNELLKNSSRATVEKHMGAGRTLPPIKVIVSQGKEDVAIKIEDEGGGIRRSDLDFIWSYNFSTAKTPREILAPHSNNQMFGTLRCERSSLYGYGMGLPHSRLHARYFGGDLHLESMEGYGTDAYVHIPCLGVKSENLESDFFQSSVWESRNGYYVGTKDGKTAEELFDLDFDARKADDEKDVYAASS